MKIRQLALGHYLNVCEWAKLGFLSSLNARSLFEIRKVGTGGLPTRTAHRSLLGSSCIHKSSAVSSTTNSRSIKRTHFDRMDWLHILTAVFGLVAVAVSSWDQCVLVLNILMENA